IYSVIKKKIAILGSTGSIGTQALSVAREFPQLFEVKVLTAANNANLLIEQALEFSPTHVVIASENHYAKVKEALQGTQINVLAGEQALCEVAQLAEADLVLTALVGFAGLSPTLAAIEAGKD